LSFRLESPIHAPKVSVFGDFTPIVQTSKGTFLRDFTSFHLSRVKIHPRV